MEQDRAAGGIAEVGIGKANQVVRIQPGDACQWWRNSATWLVLEIRNRDSIWKSSAAVSRHSPRMLQSRLDGRLIATTARGRKTGNRLIGGGEKLMDWRDECRAPI